MNVIDEKFAGVRILDPSSGASQTGLRDHNERLVLSLIRRHNSLSKAEIARRTRLSPQTVSVIMRSLEKDDLLHRGAPVRGKVGQPSIPMRLNPDGVFSIGLRIGRRSADLVLMDFVGQTRKQVSLTYPYPLPETLMDFVKKGLKTLYEALDVSHKSRVAGIGVGAPFELWNWLDRVGAPTAKMEAWRGFDLAQAISTFSDLPVLIQNDATCACSAEHVFGRGREFADYAYFFVGYFIGGGVVLNHAVHAGRDGNAGAFGSMPMTTHGKSDGQLIDCASIVVLEENLKAAGLDSGALMKDMNSWSGFDKQLNSWIDLTAKSLARASVSACSVLDFQTIMIDGGFPAEIRRRLVGETQKQMQKLDLRGIEPPQIIEASIGRHARAVGAASLPLISRYLLEQNAHA